MDDRSLAVVAVGAACPIGLDAQMVAASANAGIARKQQSGIVDRAVEPIVLGYLPEDVLPSLSDELEPLGLTDLESRLVRYASPAVQETDAMSKYLRGAPLLLATPAPDSQHGSMVEPTLLRHLVTQSGVELDLDHSELVTTGHAGAFEALRRAADDYLFAGRASYVLVGGVDSYLSLMRLGTLEAEGRLLVPGAADGFTPGEGAAFLLLSTVARCRLDNATPLALIEAVGTGLEQGHRYSESTYTGDGLADAVAEVVAQIKPGTVGSIPTVLAGLNGESFPAKEWGVCQLRQNEYFTEDCRIEHPAEYAGDMGAALAPVMLVMAVLGLRDRTLDGPVLVWASSDGPDRGAALVSRANDPPRPVGRRAPVSKR